MIISFIPTTPVIPPPAQSQPQLKPEDFANLLPEHEPIDQHPYLDGTAGLSFHEQFLLHLPVEQSEPNQDICNQRSFILYGVSTNRDSARQELRKIEREIYKIWVSFLTFCHHS
jgi:hypothetical protein